MTHEEFLECVTVLAKAWRRKGIEEKEEGFDNCDEETEGIGWAKIQCSKELQAIVDRMRASEKLVANSTKENERG